MANLVAVESYLAHYRELLFAVVAVGAVGISEAFEILLAIDRNTNRIVAGFSVVLLLTVLTAVVMAAIFYGYEIGVAQASTAGNTPDDVVAVWYMIANVSFAGASLKALHALVMRNGYGHQ